MKKKILGLIVALIMFLLALFGVGGCSTKQPVTEIKTVEEKREVILAKKPNAIIMNEIITQIIKVNGKNYIAINIEDYSKLVNNFQNLKKYIKEQKDIIDYYEVEVIK